MTSALRRFARFDHSHVLFQCCKQCTDRWNFVFRKDLQGTQFSQCASCYCYVSRASAITHFLRSKTENLF